MILITANYPMTASDLSSASFSGCWFDHWVLILGACHIIVSATSSCGWWSRLQSHNNVLNSLNLQTKPRSAWDIPPCVCLITNAVVMYTNCIKFVLIIRLFKTTSILFQDDNYLLFYHIIPRYFLKTWRIAYWWLQLILYLHLHIIFLATTILKRTP